MHMIVRLCCVSALVFGAVGCGPSATERANDPALAPADDIYEAAKNGDLEAAREFIALGQWDWQLVDRYGITPLNYAAEGGHLDIIRLMVQNGAYIEFPDGRGKTPLQAARDAGQAEAAELLESLGATK